MSQHLSEAVEATVRLRGVLERTADALARADLDALLQGEVDLAEAMDRMPRRQLSLDEQLAIRAEVERTKAALFRCRRLGEALRDVVQISQQAQGRTAGYGRDGVVTATTPQRTGTAG